MLVEFIIPTYDRIDPLRSMLSSLIAQTDKDWKASVIIDRDGYDSYSDRVIKLVSEVNVDKKITWSITDKRYNDFGHTPREIVKQQSTADFIIMTGDDNYYTPNMVMELRMMVDQWRRVNKVVPGVVYWDMVHSHFNYQYFKCVLAHGQIDMGAFATRTDLAKQIKMNTNFAADGDFVEDLKKKFPHEHKVKINKVLFVHN